MLDQSVWSLTLFRWKNTQVRVHMFFLLFGAFTLFLGWQEAQNQINNAAVWGSVACLAILFFSVCLHELGHYVTALKLGNPPKQIILGPIGGVAPVRFPCEPHNELLALVAGPFFNLIVCLACGIGLWISGHSEVLGLLRPLSPVNVATGNELEITAKLTLWINWLLVLINLIPVFPFDGGRAIRASILCYGPTDDPRQAVTLVAKLARITAVGLLICALLMWGAGPDLPVPAWFALMLLAIFILFSARNEEAQLDADEQQNGDVFGYDFSQGYTSLDRSTDGEKPPEKGVVERWLEQRRKQRRELAQRHEAEEESRVDEILDRVHKNGVNSLSSEEKTLLQRVSARFRSRNDI